ncbi:MAG TPA: glycosyltransferase [Candidatus Binatia bacterium]|nr:glycosyltransferase [Candidatus Binatia bacterium]
MRILVLTKRQYMGKDLLDDGFGRFRELPLGLARLGHDVTGIAISYRRRKEGTVVDCELSAKAHVTWHSFNLINGVLPPLECGARTLEVARKVKPDLIWAGSDAYQVIFGVWLAERVRTRCVIDLYDNFEAFGASRLPFVVSSFRHAVKRADGVTCFSQRLARHIIHNHSRPKPTTVIENGVRRDFFAIRNQQECRRQLRLPNGARFIGTAGALDGSRGIDILFKAFDLLASQSDDVHLAIAGPRRRSIRIPTGPKVHDLGILPHQEVPCFIKALDLAVICYRQSAQGKFSFPQKAYEIMACRVPLIAAAVGCMNELLSDYPQCLYKPENPQSLAEAALLQLKNRVTIATEVPSWADSAKQLDSFFEKVLQGDTMNTETQPSTEIPR